ncbi:MAG TPA: BrnT family toxin [Rhizomicrobium sp.]|nr:BrnT family toxin [Rhizomicrobium sp.]
MIRWNEAKRAANLAKHGVDFTAAAAFDWDSALVVEDTRFDYGERRYQALGIIGQRLYMLVFTPILDGFRVISLRKANKREVLFHEKSKDGSP